MAGTADGEPGTVKVAPLSPAWHTHALGIHFFLKHPQSFISLPFKYFALPRDSKPGSLDKWPAGAIAQSITGWKWVWRTAWGQFTSPGQIRMGRQTREAAGTCSKILQH